MTMMITKFHRLIQSKVLWFLFLVVIVFAFVVWAIPYDARSGIGSGKETRGVVNGEKVDGAEYNETYSHSWLQAVRLSGFDTAAPGRLGEERMEEITWRRLAARKQAEELGVTTTKQEVQQAIRSDRLFQSEDGQFNPQAYGFGMRILAQNNISQADYEKYIEEEIKLSKLQNVINKGLLVSPFEVERTFSAVNDSYTVNYTLLEPSLVEDEVEATDEYVASYYEEHKEEYRQPVQRKVKVVKFNAADYYDKVEVTDEDAQAYYDENQSEFEIEPTDEIPDDTVTEEAGEEVVEAAASEDTDAVAEAAAEDEIPVVDTPSLEIASDGSGSKTEVTPEEPEFLVAKPFSEVKAVIKQNLTKEKALNEALNEASLFVLDLTPRRGNPGADYDELVASKDLQVETIGPFVQGDPVEGIPDELDFSNEAFELIDSKDAFVSNPLSSEDSVYVLAFDEEIPESIPELESVKDEVYKTALFEAQDNALLDHANEVVSTLKDKLSGGATFAATAEELKLLAESAGPFTLREGLENIPNGQFIGDAITALNQGNIADPIKVPEGILLVHVEERTKNSTADLSTIRDSIVSSIKQARAPILFQSWQEQLQSNVERTELEIETDENGEPITPAGGGGSGSKP